MENKAFNSKLLLGGLIMSSVIMSPGILDLCLTPRFIILALSLFILVYTFYKNAFNSKLKFDLILLSYLCYAIYCSLSCLWATNLAESLFESSKTWLAFFTFLFVVYYSKKEGSGFFEALIKISILITVVEIAVISFQVINLPDLKKESIYEVTGINAHKNLASSFLFLILFFVSAGIFQLKKFWKMLSLICLILIVVAIALLRTKAVWLGLGFSALVYVATMFIYRRPNSRILNLNPIALITGFVLCLLIFFTFLLNPVIQKGINYTAGKSPASLPMLDHERLMIWSKTYQLIEKHPWLGVGSGNWQIFYPDATLTGMWRIEDLNVTFQRPHNDFLWVLSEQGYSGFILLLLFIVSLFVYAFLAVKPGLHQKEKPEATAFFISAAAGFFVVSFFDFPKERIEHLIWLNCVFGILYVKATELSDIKKIITIALSKRMLLVPCLLLFFIICIGLLRFKGEYFTRIMYNNSKSNNPSEIIRSGKAAWSFAYSIDPTSVPLHWYTGNANASLANYALALKEFKMAYGCNPYNRNVLNDLASAYVYNKEPEIAIKLYEEAARISPRFDDAKLNLVAIYLAQNDYVKAQNWLNTLLHDSERRSNYQRLLDLKRNTK